MSTFREFALSSTRIQIPRVAVVDEASTVDWAKYAQDSVTVPETVIHASFRDAYAHLRQQRLRGRADPRTIGKRGEPHARHIAYAWAPIRRKVGKDWVVGAVALHVLHATKGWKVHHGMAA